MASSSHQQATKKPCIIVAATGCIAAAKFGHLCESLKEWADVVAVATESAKEFIPRDSLPENLTMYSDATELTFWTELGDPVLHVTLQQWADMMVIAPLSANTLAKIAAGICDNLLTSVVKVWDCEAKPLFIVPAMSRPMRMNNTTETHLDYLEDEMGVRLIRHMSSDPGSMAEIAYICNTIHFVWDNLNHQPGESNEPGEPRESDEPGESNEPGEPRESDKPDESDEPGESESDEPGKSESDEPGESGKSGESNKPSKSGEPVEPGESDKPGESSESGEPGRS